MINSTFSINNRFLVDPTLNLLKDVENGNEIRLEPRLMRLLCMLSENEGKLVSREMLITKIWNDYGGAEDGLNQAISFLRKALQDSKKEIIETVPKKGYVLHAPISTDETIGVNKEHRAINLKKYGIVIVLFALFFVSYYLLNSSKKEVGNRNSEQKISSEDANIDKSIETSFSDLNIPEEETYLNTITTTSADSVKYRLVAVGDKRPKFYINNQFVPDSKREEYSDVIDKMLRHLWERQKKYNDSVGLNAPK